MASIRRTTQIGGQIETLPDVIRRTTQTGGQIETLPAPVRRITQIGIQVEYRSQPIGRTLSKFLRFIIGDYSGTLREIPITRIGPLGLVHPEVSLSALADSLLGFASAIPDFVLEFGGPLDTSALVAIAGAGEAPTLSGSYTVLAPLNGGLTPRSFGVYVGVMEHWQDGDPTFVISHSATDGVLVFGFKIVQNGDNALEYSAKLKMAPGSAAPSWGVAGVV